MGQSGNDRRRRQAGITIVELVVSLGVIAVALFAIMSMILHTMGMKENQRELTIAKQAATRRIEEIKAIPWEELVFCLQYLIQYPPSGTTFPAAYSAYPLYAFHVDGLVRPQAISKIYTSSRPYTTTYMIPQHPGLAAHGVTPLNTWFRNYANVGQGNVIIHGVYPDMIEPTLLDIEITIEWVGTKGPTKYSIRSMYSK